MINETSCCYVLNGQHVYKLTCLFLFLQHLSERNGTINNRLCQDHRRGCVHLRSWILNDGSAREEIHLGIMRVIQQLWDRHTAVFKKATWAWMNCIAAHKCPGEHKGQKTSVTKERSWGPSHQEVEEMREMTLSQCCQLPEGGSSPLPCS